FGPATGLLAGSHHEPGHGGSDHSEERSHQARHPTAHHLYLATSMPTRSAKRETPRSSKIRNTMNSMAAPASTPASTLSARRIRKPVSGVMNRLREGLQFGDISVELPRMRASLSTIC